MSFATIPSEIRYNFLLPRDIASVRLTCKKFCTEIDNLMTLRWGLIQKRFDFIQQYQLSECLIDIASWIQLPNTPNHFVKLHKLFSLILGTPSLPLLIEPNDLDLCEKKLQQIHELSLGIICPNNVDEETAVKRQKLLDIPEESAIWKQVKLEIEIPNKSPYIHFIIPHIVTYFKNLESLKVTANLRFLPTNIGALNNLTEIDLDNNHLDRLPASLECLKHLKALFLNKNNFNAFPEVVLKLKELEELCMHTNHLTSLPDFSALTKLIVLDFSCNQISFIPDAFIQNLNNLEQLHIVDNQLHAFPKAIASLTALNRFEADENPVFFIPEEILLKLNENPFTNSLIIQQHKRKLDYPATSQLGKLYQAILLGEDNETLKKLYLCLSEDNKELIKKNGAEENQSKDGDEEMLLSDLKRFSEAVEDSIFDQWEEFAEQHDRAFTLQLLEKQLKKVETTVFDEVQNRDSELHNCPPLLADLLESIAMDFD